MKLKKVEAVFIALAAAALIFCAGFFTGRGAGRDVKVLLGEPVRTEESSVTEEASVTKAPPPPEESGTTDTARININTATLEDLMLLPGIGETRARAIIEYREACGGFASAEELMEVSGIGQKIFDGLKDCVTVD